jgi:glycosyltransferase involved in cell wall biosynthesis
MNRCRKKKGLIILYGELIYDGRAQRMLKAIEQVGHLDVEVIESYKSRFKYVNNRLIQIFISHLWLLVLSGVRISKTKPEFIICLNFLTVHIGGIFAALSGATVIYDAYELLIMDPVARHTVREKIWYWIEKISIKQYDIVFSANNERSKLMLDHYKLSKMPTAILNIPSVNDVELNTPLDIEFEIGKKYVIYQGDINLDRGIGRLLDAIDYLPENIAIMLVGPGRDSIYIQKRYNSYIKNGRIKFIGPVPNKILKCYTSVASLGFVSYSKVGLNNLFCSPNKVFEYLQAGLPFISSDHLFVQKILRTHHVGETFSENDTGREIARLIQVMLVEISKYKMCIRNCLEMYNWSNEESKIVAKIKSFSCD